MEWGGIGCKNSGLTGGGVSDIFEASFGGLLLLIEQNI
jgi:hypothetical protein